MVAAAYVGRTYGRLVVEKVVRRNEHGALVLACRCACGTGVTRAVTALNASVRRGVDVSCGCFGRHTEKPVPLADMVGKFAGHLWVTALIPAKDRKRTGFLCNCVCGKNVLRDAMYLRTEIRYGAQPSCGCQTKHIRSVASKRRVSP